MDQVFRIKDSEDSLRRLFPVAFIVLHYGDKPWEKNNKATGETKTARLIILLPQKNKLDEIQKAPAD